MRVFDLTIRQTTGILLRLCRLGAVKGRAHSARHDIGVHTGRCHRNPLEVAHDAFSGSRNGLRIRLQALGRTKDPRKVALLWCPLEGSKEDIKVSWPLARLQAL